MVFPKSKEVIPSFGAVSGGLIARLFPFFATCQTICMDAGESQRSHTFAFEVYNAMTQASRRCFVERL